MADKNEILNIYTDGACKGNPGIGGWGAILEYGNTKKEIKGYSINTTNNIMELTAVIKALECLNRKCKIVITTDSNYVKNGITDWIKSWKNNGWKTAKKSPVKNKDLWIKLDSLVANHDIDWKWIKGHSGHPQNERADELANEAIILNLESYLNLDNHDKKYGSFRESTFGLDLNRRAYKIRFFYKPNNGIIGLKFNIFNFNYSGIPVKFNK